MWKRRKEELYPYFFGSDLKAVEGPVNEPQQKNEEIFIYRLSHTHLLMFSTSQQATPYLIICKGKQNVAKITTNIINVPKVMEMLDLCIFQ